MRLSRLTLLFILLGFSVYLTSLLNGFVWDDIGQIVENNIIHSLTNIPQFFTGSTFDPGGSGQLLGIYYKPLMPFFFSIGYFLFGPDPFYFHLFQLLLHIANTILVFFLFRKFFNTIIAFLLATIFLIHPLQVEAVSYISALQDTLFLFFGLSALVISFSKHKRIAGITSGLFLLLSLLSKETGALFLAMTVIYAFVMAKKDAVQNVIVSSIVALVYVFLRVEVAGITFQTVGYLPISKATLYERVLTMPKVFWHYVSSFFFPKDLGIAQHWVVKSTTFDDLYLPLFSILFFFTLTALLWFRVQHNRQKRNAFLLFLVWFLLGIGLHLQIFPLSMTVADRWFYFPIVGLLGILGVGIEEAGSIVNVQRFLRATPRFVLASSIGFILFAFCVRTIIRIGDWRDNFTLYSHDIRIVKNSFDIENGLGVELFKMGNIKEAKMHFEKSVQLVPLPVNLTNLGILYKKEGEARRAKEYFDQALSIDGGSYTTYEAVASLLLSSQNASAAASFTKKALHIYPHNPRLWMTMALAQHKLGNETEATEAAKKAVSLMSNEDYDRLLDELQIQ